MSEESCRAGSTWSCLQYLCWNELVNKSSVHHGGNVLNVSAYLLYPFLLSWRIIRVRSSIVTIRWSWTSHQHSQRLSMRTSLVWAQRETGTRRRSRQAVGSIFAWAYRRTLLVFAISASSTRWKPQRQLVHSRSRYGAWTSLRSNESCWEAWTGWAVPFGRLRPRYSRLDVNYYLTCGVRGCRIGSYPTRGVSEWDWTSVVSFSVVFYRIGFQVWQKMSISWCWVAEGPEPWGKIGWGAGSSLRLIVSSAFFSRDVSVWRRTSLTPLLATKYVLQTFILRSATFLFCFISHSSVTICNSVGPGGPSSAQLWRLALSYSSPYPTVNFCFFFSVRSFSCLSVASGRYCWRCRRSSLCVFRCHHCRFRRRHRRPHFYSCRHGRICRCSRWLRHFDQYCSSGLCCRSRFLGWRWHVVCTVVVKGVGVGTFVVGVPPLSSVIVVNGGVVDVAICKSPLSTILHLSTRLPGSLKTY